jgi:replicative DNA helicase
MLTEKQQKALDYTRTLMDPDSESEAQFNFQRDYQRSILSLLLSDRTYLTESLSLIKPTYFTDDNHKLICRLLFDHFNKFKAMPNGIMVEQAIKDRIKDEVRFMHARVELKNLYDCYHPGVEAREALQNRVLKFAKTEAVRQAFLKTFDILGDYERAEQEESWTQVYEIYRTAVTIERDFNPGLDYFNEDSVEERYRKMRENATNQDIFTLGFPLMDESITGGGPTRGEIWAVMGLPGTGKSLALVTSAIGNLILGHKVLYISCEMNELKVAQRFDSQFSNISIHELTEHEPIVLEALREHIRDYEDKRQLVIKQFNAGEADVNTLRAHHQQLKMSGFVPDMVIVDYVGEMKDAPGLKTYESRFRIVRDLRGFATEEDFFCYTAMQPNRSAREIMNDLDQFIDDDNLADAFGQTRPLDGLWSINQSKNEQIAKLARAFVIKSRSGKSRFEFPISFNSRTMKLTQTSKDEWRRKMSEVEGDAEERVKRMFEDDDKNDKKKKDKD